MAERLLIDMGAELELVADTAFLVLAAKDDKVVPADDGERIQEVGGDLGEIALVKAIEALGGLLDVAEALVIAEAVVVLVDEGAQCGPLDADGLDQDFVMLQEEPQRPERMPQCL